MFLTAPLAGVASGTGTLIQSLSIIYLRYGVITAGSHALLGGGSASLLVLTDDVGVLQHAVVDRSKWVVIGDFAGSRVSAKWSSEEENEGLGLMNLIVDPASRLLDSQVAPLLLV